MKYLKFALKAFLVLILLLGISLTSIYHYYDRDLPMGEQGVEADDLAKKMLQALNEDAYKEINYIAWTFSSLGRERQYQWQKNQGRCKVTWDSITVNLRFDKLKKSSVEINGFDYKGEMKKDYIDTAKAKFNNDSFWLVAPYKLFDKGVERRLIKQKSGQDALLVTYTSGGNTPGDSYLWLLDDKYKPNAYWMWVSLSPIGGLEATWEKWEKTTNGAFLPQLHQVLFLDLKITDLEVK